MIVKTFKKIRTKCYHCGDLVIDNENMCGEKIFCCSSCLSVYQLLNKHKMDDYYKFNSFAGNRRENNKLKSDQFDYLNNEAVLADLLNYKDETRHQILLKLPGIHCSSCIWLLERLYKLVPGIISNELNFQSKELLLSYNPNEINLSKIIYFITFIGYPVSFIKANETDDNLILFELYLKVAISGFVFGNAMFLYFPDYIDSNFAISEFRQFFVYFSLALSLPVLFYCSSDYFKSAWSSLRLKRISIDVPITLGILALFSRSLIDIIYLNQPGYLDSFNGFIFFLLLGKLFQVKSYDHIRFQRDHTDFFPLAVLKKYDDKFQYETVKNLQKSDHIKLKNGDIIPCDSILLSNFADIDYSFVSGESELKSYRKSEAVYCGGKVSGQSVELKVIKPFNKSYLTALWSSSKKKETTFTNSTDQISSVFTISVLFIAAFSYVFHSDISTGDSIDRVIAIFIVACPCAIALSAPFTFGSITGILAKNGFYIRDTSTIEELSRIKHIIFDKTGTLNSGKNAIIDVQLERAYLKELSSIFNESKHPLSQCILNQLDKSEMCVTYFEEINGKGIKATINKNLFTIGSAEFLKDNQINSITNSAVGSIVHVAVNDTYIGYISINRSLRAGIDQMLKRIKRFSQIYLLSGDNDLEQTLYLPFFGNKSMQFYQSPFDKEKFINSKIKKYDRCAILGDGLNDSAALATSSVGIAVSDDQTHFSPNSDAVLNAEKLQYFDHFLRLAQLSRWVVYLSFIFAILYNVIGITYAFNGYLTPLVSAILMPLSSFTIIVFSIGASNLIAKYLELN